MKRFTFLLCMIIVCYGSLIAQAETEPNNSLSLANTFSEGSNVTGSTSSADNDYFLSVPNDDGTLTIRFSYSGGSALDDFYIYAYNKVGGQVGSQFLYNSASGNDSLVLYCRQQDTFFVRIHCTGGFSYQFSYSTLSSGLMDAEPNDNISQAVNFTEADTVQGHIGYTSAATDNDDYFISVLPDDGTIKYYVKYDNTSGATSSDFFSYIYNKAGALIGNSYKNNQPLGITYDTITVYCRAADTVYFRIGSNGCFSYEFQYDLFPSGTPDPEPNGTLSQAIYFTEADTVRGRIGYTSVATDDDDYFISVLPDDGTIKYYVKYNNTSGATSSDFFSYIYNKAGALIGNSYKYNQPLGITYDTITVYCRAADTVYFRIESNGCFSYEFQYDVFPSGTPDAEPNGTLSQAVNFTEADTVRGRIGYTSAVTDDDDYFISVLPDDGTIKYYVEYDNTSGATSSDFFSYIYNKAGALIGNSYKYNQPVGITYDTITVYCREADTVYFRIGSNGCFSYEFQYDVFSSGTPDAEPNGTLSQAVNFTEADTVRGRIGYTSVGNDFEDNYIIAVPEDGSMRCFVEFNNTSNSTGSDFYTYVLNKNGGTISSSSQFNQSLGIHYDTVIVNCSLTDTVYVRIRASGCFSYKFFIETNEEKPTASIETIQFGNKISFSSQVRNANQIQWDLAGGDQSNLRFPIKDYPIGVFPISFTATNTGCNFSEIVYDTLIIAGIEDYSPKRAGTDNGLGFFTMRLFGAGLDTNAVVTLRQGATTLQPSRIRSPQSQELSALFSLKNAPLGKYDIEVLFSSGQQSSVPQGFEIYEDAHEWKVYTRLNGPSRIRTGRTVNYALDVINENGIIANGVRLFVVVPKGVETDIADIMLKKTGKLSIKGATWNMLSIDLTEFSDTYFQGGFDPNVDTVLVDFDSIFSAFDTLASFEISQLYNEPFDGRVYPLYIPFINANSTYTLNFKVKSNSSQQFPIVTYVWPYAYRRNPINDCTLGFIHDTGLQLAAVAELAPHPALKAVGKSAGYVDIGSQVAFTEFFDWYYGVNNADATFYGRQTLALGGELAGEIAPFKGSKNFDTALDQASAAKSALKNSSQYKSILQETITNGRLSPNMANQLSKELGILNDVLANSPGAITTAQKTAAVNAARHILEKNGLNLGSSEIQDLLFPKDTPSKVNEPKEKEEKPVESVTSMDPNAIYGNAGAGVERYVRKSEQLNYMITFENVDTAQASAQIVRVIDTLDATVFDLAATKLGYITIGGKFYRLEEDRQSYFRDIDLRPTQNLIVRVNASIDTASGVLSWEFVSLDPLTLDLPADPLVGFLPPNVNFPDGEGSVTFHTRFRKGIVHLDSASTSALIYFDENKPIATNIWKHIVDDLAPTASINPNIALNNDTTFTLTLNGSDAESGLRSFKLFVKPGNGVWNGYTFNGEDGLEVEIIGEIGETYEAYVLGIDSVGNKSDSISTTPIMFTITDIPADNKLSAYMQVGPNPCNESLNVYTPMANIENIRIVDAMGRVCMSQSLERQEKTRMDVSRLTPGIYFLTGKHRSGELITVKIIKR